MKRIQSNDSLINKLHLFTRHLPDASVIFSLLFVASIATGIISVALINYHLAQPLEFIIADGILSGILIVFVPALLTVLMIKSIRRYVRLKYLLFIAFMSAVVYCIFIILASAFYYIFGSLSLSSLVILLGDAGIYGLWFFVSKVVLGQKKKAVIFALAQPIFNVLVYIAASVLIFTFYTPLNVILVKLFAGILVFLVISYFILYILDSPLKRNLGFGGIDAFSQFVQNWLFDIDVMVAPFGGDNFGISTEIDTHTIVFKNDKRIKAILFAPQLHYGPVGTMGGSNFPYLLEKYGYNEFGAPLFVMHATVNEDNNPISSSQIVAVKQALNRSVRNSKPVNERKTVFTFTESSHNNAKVSLLKINKIGLATFTRAPYVTEDIAPEAARLFRELFESEDTIMIDAHNSRYESAPAEELKGVTPNSEYMNDYIKAIKGLGKPMHSSKKIKIGVSTVDIYNALDSPLDLAPGSLSVMLFHFNGFKYAIIQFNANNVLPNVRNAIIKHVKKEFGVVAELYTTDTHFVNSLERNASNVLGRFTSSAKLIPFIEKAIKSALEHSEPVDVYYKRDSIKGFKIWGPDVREKATATVTSVLGIARVLVPAIVAFGFVIASWIISLV